MITKPDFCSGDELQNMLYFLDGLRESGATNMFGAAPYLVDEFDLTKSEARTIVIYWMETFAERRLRRVVPVIDNR